MIPLSKLLNQRIVWVMHTRKHPSQTDEVNKAYGRVDESAKKTSVSFTQQVTAVNTLALSGLTLGLSFERVEKAQLANDKANLLVEKSLSGWIKQPKLLQLP